MQHFRELRFALWWIP